MKKIKAVLFDLDGTLLPLDNDLLSKTYFSELTAFMVERGYSKDDFCRALYGGIEAMFKNDGAQTNEQIFKKVFSELYPADFSAVQSDLDRFYKERFVNVKRVCGFSPLAKTVVELVKAKGLKAALATQPVFPYVATESRMSWAGLKPDDFSLITTFENSRYSKPKREYYLEISKALGVLPEECLMVGNDAKDDLGAAYCGMKMFFLDTWLINREKVDISEYPVGTFEDLISFIEKEL